METSEKIFRANIEIPASQLPCVVRFSSRAKDPAPANGFFSGISWSLPQEIIEFHNVGKAFSHSRGLWAEEVIYVTERSVDTWIGGVRTGLYCTKSKPGSKMQLFFRGRHDVDNFSIQHVSATDIPDVHEYLDAIERLPSGIRTGRVELPGLKSDVPSEKVVAEFFVE